jgi:hypothetical protein
MPSQPYLVVFTTLPKDRMLTFGVIFVQGSVSLYARITAASTVAVATFCTEAAFLPATLPVDLNLPSHCNGTAVQTSFESSDKHTDR